MFPAFARRAVIPFVTPRKEVIHPLLPERIPCYDLALIADLTFGGLPPVKRG